jgi:hypothetical protein
LRRATVGHNFYRRAADGRFDAGFDLFERFHLKVAQASCFCGQQASSLLRITNQARRPVAPQAGSPRPIQTPTPLSLFYLVTHVTSCQLSLSIFIG